MREQRRKYLLCLRENRSITKKVTFELSLEGWVAVLQENRNGARHSAETTTWAERDQGAQCGWRRRALLVHAMPSGGLFWENVNGTCQLHRIYRFVGTGVPNGYYPTSLFLLTKLLEKDLLSLCSRLCCLSSMFPSVPIHLTAPLWMEDNSPSHWLRAWSCNLF